MPSRHMSFGYSGFYVPALTFLAGQAGGLSASFCSRAGGVVRDWRSALSKGCTGRLSLRHLSWGALLFIIKDLSWQRVDKGPPAIIIEAAKLFRHQGLFAGCKKIFKEFNMSEPLFCQPVMQEKIWAEPSFSGCSLAM